MEINTEVLFKQLWKFSILMTIVLEKLTLKVRLSSRFSCFIGLHDTDIANLFSNIEESDLFYKILTIVDEPQKYFGVIRGSARKGEFEISRHFAESLSIEEGQYMTVRGVRPFSLPLAPPSQMVVLKPVRAEHFDVVEQSSGFLEHNLLSQIGILTSGLIFPVWVDEGSPILLRAILPENLDVICLKMDTEVCIESGAEGDSMLDKQKKKATSLVASIHSFPRCNFFKYGIQAIVHPQVADELQLLRLALLEFEEGKVVIPIGIDIESRVQEGELLLAPSLASNYSAYSGKRVVIMPYLSSPLFTDCIEVIPINLSWEATAVKNSVLHFLEQVQEFSVSEGHMLNLPLTSDHLINGLQSERCKDAQEEMTVEFRFPKLRGVDGVVVGISYSNIVAGCVDIVVAEGRSIIKKHILHSHVCKEILEAPNMITLSNFGVDESSPPPSVRLPSYSGCYAFLEKFGDLAPQNVPLCILGGGGSGKLTILKQMLYERPRPALSVVLDCRRLIPEIFKFSEVSRGTCIFHTVEARRVLRSVDCEQWSYGILNISLYSHLAPSNFVQ